MDLLLCFCKKVNFWCPLIYMLTFNPKMQSGQDSFQSVRKTEALPVQKGLLSADSVPADGRQAPLFRSQVLPQRTPWLTKAYF